MDTACSESNLLGEVGEGRMNNNDIVFDALRICITEGKCTNTDCPYEMFCKFNGKEQYVQIPKALALDVLNELKEQEAKTVIKIAKRFNDCDLTGYCPSCSRPLIKDWAENYCGYCGKPILWEGR